MKIEETNPPAERNFTFNVNADELRVITAALYADDSYRSSGKVVNHELWSQFDDFMEENSIVKSTEIDS